MTEPRERHTFTYMGDPDSFERKGRELVAKLFEVATLAHQIEAATTGELGSLAEELVDAIDTAIHGLEGHHGTSAFRIIPANFLIVPTGRGWNPPIPVQENPHV